VNVDKLKKQHKIDPELKKVALAAQAAASTESGDIRESIKEIRLAMQRLEHRGLNRRGVEVLVTHHCKLGLGTVRQVLDSLQQIEDTYCS
jgi:hypothetical protein